MSEQLQHKTELLPAHFETTAESEQRLKLLQEAGREAAERHQSSSSVESLQHSAEAQAISGAEITVGERQENTPSQSYGLQKELKDQAYKKTLQKAQSHLGASERAFSRILHKPVVHSVSQVASQTVGRPSGVLGGSLFALLGSAVLLYVTKYYGFVYNYTAFLLLFLGGFIIGLLLELIVRSVQRARS